MSKQTYAQINRVLMTFLFFIPMCVSHLSRNVAAEEVLTAEGVNPIRLCIAIYESQISPVSRNDLNALVCEPDDYQEAEEDPKPAEEEREGAEISKIKFEELKKRMPVRRFPTLEERELRY